MHVLVPLDGSEQAERALQHALDRFPDAELTVLHVVDLTAVAAAGGFPGEPYQAPTGVPGYSQEWMEQKREAGEELLADARERAAEAGVDCDTDLVVGKPARDVVDYADEHGVDQIVMGSHGRSGASRILLGSVAEKVVRRAGVPVTVVR